MKRRTFLKDALALMAAAPLIPMARAQDKPKGTIHGIHTQIVRGGKRIGQTLPQLPTVEYLPPRAIILDPNWRGVIESG